MRGLIRKRIEGFPGSGFGLKAVPVNYRGQIGAVTANYWKAGGSAPLLADRCLECGYQVGPNDSFLYLADVDLGEEVLWWPPHVFCGDCVEALATEGTWIEHEDGTFAQVPPLDLSEPFMPELHDYLLRRLQAGATSVRRFHPREVARMFGLPDWWPLPDRPGPATRLLGNSLHVPTAVAVLCGVVAALAGPQGGQLRWVV